MSESTAVTNWRQPYIKPRKFDDDAMAIYLNELKKHGLVTRAAVMAGVTRWTILDHRKRDPEFATAEEEAREVYADYVRERVRAIGIDGLEEKIYGGKFKTQVVGKRLVIAPAVTILEAKRVDKAYRDKAQLDVTHRGGVLLVPSNMTPDEWEKENIKPKPREINAEVEPSVQAEESPGDNEG